MNAIVVYESVFGNTRAVAEAVAEGLGAVPVLPVHDAVTHTEPLDLLVVGGPTHAHGLATTRSRHTAAHTVEEHDAYHVEPDAAAEPGLRSWLADIAPGAGRHAAAFDTRLDKPKLLTGAAAHGIARRLRRHRFDVIATESFLVKGSEGPLEAGELERARAWGAKLARSVTADHQESIPT
jgi:hypothetical protein